MTMNHLEPSTPIPPAWRRSGKERTELSQIGMELEALANQIGLEYPATHDFLKNVSKRIVRIAGSLT
jgi:hypothetical protein